MTIHKTQVAFINALKAKCSGAVVATDNESISFIEGRLIQSGKEHKLRLQVECVPENNGKAQVIVTSAPHNTKHRAFMGLVDLPAPKLSFNTDDGASRLCGKATQCWDRIHKAAIEDFAGCESFTNIGEGFEAESIHNAEKLGLVNITVTDGVPVGFVPINETLIEVRVVRDTAFLLDLQLNISKAQAVLQALSA